jgi:hypothetical protein
MHGFVSDDALDYLRLRTVFAAGEGLLMDEPYRRAHLPLVAPDHPAIIASDPARGYAMGRHGTVWSLVVPVPWRALQDSPVFGHMLATLRTSPLAGKIAWDAFDRRHDVLHATICGGLGQGDATPANDLRHHLSGFPSFRIRLRGLFSGNINLGRLYLRVYPEARNGRNMIHAVQERLGRPQTSLYVVGLFNLIDHLTVAEAAWLAGWLDRVRDSEIVELDVTELWLLGARDDLALDSEVAQRIALG